MALGGASAGVGAVCEAVADRLAVDPGLPTSIWLERGGRLRCVAGMGGRPGRVGVSPTAGAVGATFTDGAETVATGDPDARVAEACLPIRSDGCVVGVLEVRLTGPVRAEDLDAVRRAADELGDAIAALGGPPAESAAQRMLRHLTSLSALEDAHAITRAVLAAAIDLIALESAALVPAARSDGDPAVAAIGPLGPELAALPHAVVAALARTAEDGAAAVMHPGRGAMDHATGHADPADHATRAADHAMDHLAERPPRGRRDGATRPGDHTMDHPASGPAHRGNQPADHAPLRTAGIGTLVAVALGAQGQPRGVLLLGGRADRPVPPEDLELLELLAAHAATCLRTADLVRSLRERAATDPLTGLGHHATFHETLAHTHRRPQTAVVLVDVDGFKRLNDTFGHQHGDQVLRAIAAALSSALRRGDTLFRIGGDEFAALIAVADAAEALDAGMRLRAAVAEARLGVTVSIGVAVPREGEPDAALLDRADRALYRVKAAGRDGVEVADDDAGAAPLAAGPPA